MNCKIIQDLIPLYCDGLTSQESNEEIKKHLSECDECNDIYKKMDADDEKINVRATNINPLKKIKRRSKIIILSIVGAIILLFALASLFPFLGILPTAKSTYYMEYKGQRLTDGSIEIQFIVNDMLENDYNFYYKEKEVEYLSLDSEAKKSKDVYIYRSFKMPWDNDKTDKNIVVRTVIYPKGAKINEDDNFCINGFQSSVTYYYKDVAEHLGLCDKNGIVK